MCDPVTMATAQIAIGAASAGAAYMGASAQAENQQALHNQNAENAVRARNTNYRNLSARVQQEDAAALQEKQAIQIEAAQAAATAEVASGEAGVTGNSVGNLLRGVYGTLGRNLRTSEVNSRNRRSAAEGELENLTLAAQSQINSVPQATKPSVFPYILQGVSSGMKPYTEYQARKAT